MLKTKVSGYLFSSTNYSIKEVMNGKDTLTLTIPTEGEDSQQIIPELEVIELKHSNSEFVVKSINGDDDELEVTMDLNLDDFNSRLFIGFNKTGGPFDILNTVVPDGWTVEDHFGSTESKTVELEAPTAEEVADSVVNVFGAAIRYDFKTRTQHVYNPSAMVSNGEYVTKELNLVSLSRYQSSSGLVNRLYFYGKEGLSFEDINDGKPYVEDTSYLKGKVKCKYMKDERFTDKQSMLEYAKTQLKTMSAPVSSYECVPNDIGSVDVKYQFLKLDLMSVVTLMDVDRNARVDHQVVEREIHPYDKTQNTLTLSTSTPTLTGTTNYVSEQISNPNSELHQQIQTDMDRIAEGILKGSDGHVVINYGDDGKRAEILIMDTDDKETAKDVMRLSKEGIAFSVRGYNGPFTGAIALSGEWFAQFIATWRLTANIIVAGRLQDKSGDSYWDLDKSEMVMNGRFRNSNGDYLTDFWAAIYTMTHTEYERVKLYSSAGSPDTTTGVMTLSQGKFKGEGGHQDDKSRQTYIDATTVSIGNNRSGGATGSLICGNGDFSDSVQAEGKIKGKVLECSRLAITGKSELALDWVRVKKADGSGDAWAVCGIST